jgi:hypothetical protein
MERSKHGNSPARWAGKELGGEWSRLIERALVAQAGQADFDLYERSLALIRLTKERTDIPML